jgi:Lar family restriction alleviation protein
MTEELKPCPFCGRKVTLIERDQSEGYRYLIRCENCEGDFENPQKVVADFCFCSDDKEAIIKKWNTRAKCTEPVRHAKLLNAHPYGECSNCGYLIDIREEFNYCPNCGCRVDEE